MDYLPRIMRMMNYNIGMIEMEEIILFIDKNQIGKFSMKELITLLSEFKFIFDKQKDLLEAFQDLDYDGDGYIPKDEMIKFMTIMGEPLDEKEQEYLLDLSSKNSADPNMIDIQLMTKALVPSNNILNDL